MHITKIKHDNTISTKLRGMLQQLNMQGVHCIVDNICKERVILSKLKIVAYENILSHKIFIHIVQSIISNVT